MSENVIFQLLEFQSKINASLADKKVISIRHKLADFSAEQFLCVSNELLENDINDEDNDVINAIALIIKIGASLMSGANQLFTSDNTYSAAALVRQIVEIEYLAWAFENNSNEANKWIKSNKEERMKFFSPAKLRQAAQGKFRSKDYGYHCELGGHPVPDAEKLLDESFLSGQLLLSDMLGHSGRIWEHLFGWADGNKKYEALLSRKEIMRDRYMEWKHVDIITKLPPPP